MSGRTGRPGSVPWLLAHDLRLAWRDLRATFRVLDDRALAILIVVLVAVMHAAAWPLAAHIRDGAGGDAAGRAAAYARAAPVVLFVLLLMVAQTLTGATKLLYARGDLDLLLSSPVPAGKTLFVRALAVAAGAFVSAAFFVAPLADAGAIAGDLRLLAAYPALVGGAWLAASVGLVVALGLFAVIGPRGTRLAAQILATFVGAGFILGAQLRRFLPSFSVASLLGLDGATPGPGRFVLLLPVRAALGEPMPLALWLIVTGGLFAAVCTVLGNGFARSAQAAAGTPGQGRRPRRPTPDGASRPRGIGARTFAAGLLGTLRRKEWRLIARDPWVVSQILLQILYMTPMIVLLWSGSGSVALALAPMVVVVTFQVASSLTWLGLSGEDAPDLLASAPVEPRTVRRGKLQAVGLLTLAIVALPLGWLAVSAPAAAAAAVAFGAMGLCSAVALQSWHGKPARRSAFAARHRESKIVALIEMALSMVLGVTTALAVMGTPLFLAPLALAGTILFFSRPRRGRGAV